MKYTQKKNFSSPTPPPPKKNIYIENLYYVLFIYKIGLGGGFKVSTQNREIHYLW